MNYAVIGFPKCGTASMQEYLMKKYPDSNSVKLEFPIYGEAHKFEKELKGYRPVILTRDRKEMLWSFYNYFSMTSVPFEDFLEMPIRAYNMKGLTPLEQTDYDRWIEPFKKYDPWILTLDEAMKLDGFPHNEITRTKNKPKMPDDVKRILESLE